MSEKAFKGVSVSTKGGHSKLRGQPLQRHASAWWRCVQMAHGEDLDRLNGGSESSVHFVWGRRTQQDRLEQSLLPGLHLKGIPFVSELTMHKKYNVGLVRCFAMHPLNGVL